jgi:hypothetical protein
MAPINQWIGRVASIHHCHDETSNKNSRSDGANIMLIARHFDHILSKRRCAIAIAIDRLAFN